ncbi:MAG: 16S rRNA (uracil(1498)-N(3))-methyltransferase [Pseudomonadota bacterium]
MRIPRIYTTQSLAKNSTVHLDAAAAHYVANVLRMKPDRPIVLFNGEGGEYHGRLAVAGKKLVSVKVLSYIDKSLESPLKIQLGVCLIKSDRMDWLLQKATELGVSSVTPLFSEYSDIKLPANRYEKKLKHWRQVMTNACQQSGRTLLPTIGEPAELSVWLQQVDSDFNCILHPHNAANLNTNADVGSITLLVGPEGGFAESEITLAHKYKFLSLSLGPRILRAETAPLAALALLQYHFGDF